MFPRIVTSHKKSGAYRYLVLSESIHIKGKGSTTRNIANLGNLTRFNQRDIENLIDGLIKLFQVDKYAVADQVEVIECLEHGSIIFWRKLWETLQLGATIRSLLVSTKGRVKIATEKYIELMVINRLADPLSKLGATRWVERTCYKVMRGYADLPVEVEYFYRSMDYLLTIKNDLEKALFQRMKNLFSINVQMTFYDITSTFFYNDHCPIGKHGYSRDHRPDKEQIVIGVVTSYEGYPIKHFVFEGNKKDETTVIEVVRQLKAEYHIEEMTFVGDRGMITKLNLHTIEVEGFDYIMGVKHRQSEVHAMLFAEGERIQEQDYREYRNGLEIQERSISIKSFLVWKAKGLFQKHQVKEEVGGFSEWKQAIEKLTDKGENSQVTEYLQGRTGLPPKLRQALRDLMGKYSGCYETHIRTIICRNAERKALAKKSRDQMMARLTEELQKVLSGSAKGTDALETERRLRGIFEGNKHRYGQFFRILREEKTKRATSFVVERERVKEAEERDGLFLLTTSRQDLSAETIVDSYKNLKEVEMLFDDLKHFVDIHPVRHWLEIRVRAHVFLCVLALLLKRIWEVNQAKSKAVMVPLEEIAQSKLVQYQVKFCEREERTKPFYAVTKTTARQKQLFEMVGIKNPMSLEDYVW
jgi:transposase